MGINWTAVIIVALNVLIVVVAHKLRWFRVPKREPLFPLFDDAARKPLLPSSVLTARGVDIPLGYVEGWDLLDLSRCVLELDRLPEIADPTEALAW